MYEEMLLKLHRFSTQYAIFLVPALLLVFCALLLLGHRLSVRVVTSSRGIWKARAVSVFLFLASLAIMLGVKWTLPVRLVNPLYYDGSYIDTSIAGSPAKLISLGTSADGYEFSRLFNPGERPASHSAVDSVGNTWNYVLMKREDGVYLLRFCNNVLVDCQYIADRYYTSDESENPNSVVAVWTGEGYFLRRSDAMRFYVIPDVYVPCSQLQSVLDEYKIQTGSL